MSGVAPTGGLLRNVVSLLRTLSAAPANPDRATGAGAPRGQSLVQSNLVQPNGDVEGPVPPQPAGRVLDQPRLTAVQLEYSPPSGGFDPYARRGTYLDITV
jgi:hypothetical protein